MYSARRNVRSELFVRKKKRIYRVTVLVEILNSCIGLRGLGENETERHIRAQRGIMRWGKVRTKVVTPCTMELERNGFREKFCGPKRWNRDKVEWEKTKLDEEKVQHRNETVMGYKKNIVTSETRLITSYYSRYTLW